MFLKHLKLYVCILINLTAIEIILCQCELENLRKILIPKGYAKNIVPTKSEKKPTLVYVSVHVLDIDYILEEKMEFSMNLNLYEFWRDDRLNLSCFEIREKIPREFIFDIWTPDIIFENLKEGFVHTLPMPNIILRVVDHGYLNRITRYSLRLSCHMDLHKYPMDTQSCYLHMDSLSNNDSKMLLKWFHERKEKDRKIKNLLISNINPLKYKLVSITPGSVCNEWPNGNYTTLYANFTLERRLSSHVFNFYIPSGLVVLLSSLTFWYSVKSASARLTVGLTSLLTLSTEAWQAHNGLPSISYLTALDLWLFSCIIQVFLTLVVYTAIYHLYRKKVCRPKIIRKDYKASPKSKVNRVLEWNYIRNDIIYAKEIAEERNEPNSSNDDGEFNGEPGADVETLDKICRYLFPIGFVIFALAYWIHYLS